LKKFTTKDIFEKSVELRRLILVENRGEIEVN
jgi:hypothetical protein